jgi:hypothetical protein
MRRRRNSMVKTLHFDILVKDNAVCDVDRDRLEYLWPAYCSNIHVLHHATGFNYDVMVKARMLVNGHQIVAVSRSVTRNEIMFAGTFNDAIDFVMGEVLNRVNKTQHTSFSRHVSCIDLFTAINPKPHSDVADSLVSAFECYNSSRSKYKTWYKQYIDIPELKRLHSSGPVSVAIWSNGKKSMVRKQKGDKSDPEKGILYAVIKGLCYEKGGTKEYSRVLDMIHEALEERKNG